MEQHQFQELESHLLEVSNGNSDLDTRQINDFVNSVSVDKAVVLQNPEYIKSLLSVIIELLHNENLDIDYDRVIEVLEVIVLQLDFEDITSSFFSIEYLIEALKSNNRNLQTLALRVATSADPLDLIASTEIVPLSIDLLADSKSPIKLVNEIEKAFGRFLYSKAIRQRLLCDDVLDVLRKMSESKNEINKARYLDFIVKIFPFVEEDELPIDLYNFSVDFSEDSDIFSLLNLIKFYNDLIDVSNESLNKTWILKNIEPQLLKIGELYANRSQMLEIESFALSAISQLLKSLSYSQDGEVLQKVDSKFFKFNKNDTLILSSLNPEYLARNHAELLSHIQLNVTNIPIFRNLIRDETAFSIIKPQITTNALLKLPYLELVAVLVVLTKFIYGSKYLLVSLPQVMNKLLKGDNIIETETFQLRRFTLENLNALSNEELGVWKNTVHREYSLAINGSSNPGLAEPLTL